jgi:hypothetical protein
MLRSVALFILACSFFSAYSQADFASVKNEINFAPNRGQVLNSNGQSATDVLAKASVPGMDLYLTTHGLSYVFLNYEEDKDAPVHPVFINEKQHKIHYSRVDVDLVGATLTAAQMQWAQPTITKTNHYYGNIRVENLEHYQQVTIANVYPGIDWVWKVKDNQQLEYDFVVHPQADASVIKMEYHYATPEVAPTYLKVHTKNGGLTEGELLAYNAGERVPVTYALNGNAVSFNISAYDKSKLFVIDPPLFLDWQALYGGSYADALRAVTTDAQGNIYMAGYSTSPNFPVWNGVPGAYFDGTLGGKDAVVIKTSSTPNLQWATYLGGNNIDVANSVTVDAQGRVYVAGLAGGNFPLQFGAGNFNTGVVTAGGFITRFSPALTMQWSSGIGGNGVHEALKVYTDSRSNIWVTGYTNGGFPVYNNAQFAYNSASGFTNNVDAFAMLFDTLNNVKWSAIYGGSGDDYAASCVTDTAGKTYVVGFTTAGGLPAGFGFSAYGGGTDGFMWEPRNNRRIYVGGSSNDFIFDITCTKTNQLFITGRTQSPNFPVQQSSSYAYYQGTQAGYYDAFITRFRMEPNNLPEIDWSTYYGGATNDETATGIACDKDNRVYITGFTASTDFPVQASTQLGAFYQGTKGGLQDAFIAGFSMNGKRFWSTYRGGTCLEFANDIACSATPNKVYVVGEGLYACNQSVPDSNAVGAGGSASGFIWAFDGGGACGSATVQTTVPCPLACNGLASVNLTGAAPLQIEWMNGSTDTVINLCDVTGGGLEVVLWAEDANACAYYFNDYLEVLNAPEQWVAILDVGCYSWQYGSTLLNPEGGTPPYNMNWSSSNATNYYQVPDGSGVITYEPGEFIYEVEDAAGCWVGGTVMVGTLNYPASATINVVTQTSCGNNNGELQAVDLNGAPVSIYWTINGVQQAYYGSTITNAAPGIYEVDSFIAGCTNMVFDFQTTVLDPSAGLSASALIVPVSCLGNNGAVYVTVAGGVQPYYFSWSNGSTDVNLPWLTDGNMQYGMLVTDDNGCTLDTSFFVPYADFTPQVLITVLRNPSCGLNNGLLVARNLQGQPVVTDWILPDNSIIYTDTVFNAAPGNYSLNNGYCVNGVYTQQTVFVPDSGNIQVIINVTQVPINCIVNNGSLEAGVASNDNPPYTYAWSNGSNIPLAVNLAPGQSYTVTVTDNLGCSATAVHTFAPGQGPLITATNMVSPTCVNDTNGQLSLSLVGGGGPPYSFIWSNGATTTTATGLAEGQYWATVAGANGCPTVSSVIDLERNGSNLLSIAATAPSCGNANGSITATPLAGSAPFAYDWSTGDTGPTLSGLTDGVYTVTVTPTGMLPYNTCIRFYPSANNVQAPVTITPAACQGFTTVSAAPAGGLAPYSILWSNGETVFSFAQTSTDTVRGVVTDSLGCTYNIEEYVTVTPALDVTYNQTPILCYGGMSTVQIAATGGVPTYTGTGTFTLPAGTYSYIVTDNGGCADTADFIVDEPTELEAAYAATPIACNGGTTIISVVAGGGTPAYTGEGNFTRPAGNYSFIVTDARGCKDTVAVSLTQPTDLTTTVTPPATFNCDAPISVTVSSTGGTPPYTGTGTVSVTPNTNANIIVTDNAGCKDTTTYNLTLPQGLSTTITGADTICKGQNVVFAASGNFDFTWQGNVTADTLTLNNVQNTTTVIVQGISPEGCVVNDTVTLVADVCIGINEVANAAWYVYPNPATNQFVIEWNGMNDLQAYRLFANDGKLVSETKLDATQQSTVVDCTHFAAGVYVLQLQTNGSTFYKKLVIEK